MRWTEVAEDKWAYRTNSAYASAARVELSSGQYLVYIREASGILSHIARYDTLVEAQAVAIALIAMRDKK